MRPAGKSGEAKGEMINCIIEAESIGLKITSAGWSLCNAARKRHFPLVVARSSRQIRKDNKEKKMLLISCSILWFMALLFVWKWAHRAEGLCILSFHFDPFKSSSCWLLFLSACAPHKRFFLPSLILASQISRLIIRQFCFERFFDISCRESVGR